MRAFAVAKLLAIAGCEPEQDITGTTPACPARLYSSYNRKDINQCSLQVMRPGDDGHLHDILHAEGREVRRSRAHSVAEIRMSAVRSVRSIKRCVGRRWPLNPSPAASC